MASPRPAGDVLPRPRIPNVIGILNIIFATFLMLFSLYMGWYAAIMPVSHRAMVQVRQNAEAAREAQLQAERKSLEESEKNASTVRLKAALAAKLAALQARPKVTIPYGMDLEQLGLVGLKFTVYSWVDVITALALDALMVIAGLGLLQRKTSALRLAIATAAAKIIRLVLLYSYVVLAIVPPIAQASGRMAIEITSQQQKAMGGPGMPPMMNVAFFTKMYYVMYTVTAVSMVLFGVIYPAISLWFLSRPGAWAACEPRARHNRRISETRALGITNIVFAACLMLFGLCLGTYVAALPVLGRTITQIQKKTEAAVAAKQKAALKALAEEEEKAATDDEKQTIADQRKAIEARPKPANPLAALDFGKMGFDDPKILAYYWVDLTTGLVLNIAMITAGIALVRRKPWGITLGAGTAAAKIIRLVLVYSYFIIVAAPVLAGKSAAMIGNMIVQQQSLTGGSAPPAVDTEPLRKAYAELYPPVAVAFIVLGSLYPAVSLWVLLRPREQAGDDQKPPPEVELIGS
jgi:hypothetical protein